MVVVVRVSLCREVACCWDLRARCCAAALPPFFLLWCGCGAGGGNRSPVALRWTPLAHSRRGMWVQMRDAGHHFFLIKKTRSEFYGFSADLAGRLRTRPGL